MREAYSDLVTTKQWPALRTTIPESNFGSTTDDDNEPRKNPNGRTCFDCGSDTHYKGSPDCPNGTKGNNDKGKHGGSTNGSDWRFIAPSDENAEIMMNDIKYYFCKHCVCKHTKRKGFFNRTHCTKDHNFPGAKKKLLDSPSSSASVTTANTEESSITSSISSLGSGSASNLEGNLSKLTVKPVLSSVSEHLHVDPDPDGLEFVAPVPKEEHYEARVQFDDINQPTVNALLANDLGVNVVWTRTGVGVFFATFSAPVDDTKLTAYIGGTGLGTFTIGQFTSTYIQFIHYAVSGGPSDPTGDIPVEIKLYP